jgi:hypothetical protein
MWRASSDSASAGVTETAQRPVAADAQIPAGGPGDELLTEPKQTIESIPVRESKSERSIRMILSLLSFRPT